VIEQKLVVGRYLELNTPQPVNAGPAVNGFQEVNRQIIHINESKYSAAPVSANNPIAGFAPNLQQRMQIGLQRAGETVQSKINVQRTSATAPGQSPKIHRNFTWLEWLPGVVSEIRPNGVDVLTGPMTGCWVTSYIRNGVHYVGHVGTDMAPNTPNSLAAKAAWNNYVAGVPISAYSGFNPFNDPWTHGPVPQAQPGEANRKTFALVTVEGHFYTVIAYPQANKPSRIRIAGIQRNYSSLPVNGRV
jgi:hypothetical protein